MPETRRRTNAEELAGFYAKAVDPWWDFGDFLLWSNPAFKGVAWERLSDPAIVSLPEAQRVILAIVALDGDVTNGGIEQLCFNYSDEIEVIRHGVRALGWNELLERFERHYHDAFVATEIEDRIDQFRRTFGADAAKDHEAAWAEFRDICGEVPGDSFNDWYFAEERRGELNREMLRFIRAHESELMIA